MTGTSYRDSIYIDAEPRVVFEYFVDPAALVQWMGDRAILDARPGGRFILFFDERAVEGRYVEIDPPRRVVITWGRARSATFPPGASTLVVTLTPEGRGTRVAIVHSGLPNDELDRHVAGWRHYLMRLALVAAGGTAEPHRTPEHLTRGVEDA